VTRGHGKPGHHLAALLSGLLKVGVALLFVGVLGGMILSIAFFGPIWKSPPGDHQVGHRLREILPEGDTAVVVLSEVTTFEWSRVCIAGGYDNKSNVEALIGVDWDYYWIPGFDETEGLTIFLQGDNVVATSGAKFFSTLPSKCYTPEEATFRVQFGNGSRRRLWEMQ
jgi:hypothetical protein